MTIQPYLSVDKLPPGGTCRFVMFVKIKDGWHIHTDKVEEEWQVRSEVGLQSKLGVKVERVAFEKGKPANVPGARRPVIVYEQQAVLRGVLSVPQEAAGKPDTLKFTLKYQACNAAGTCLAPTTATAAGTVPVAANLQSVRSINPNLFPKLQN